MESDIETYEHPEEGVEEVWVADPCGGAFGRGTSEIRVYHVETDDLDDCNNLFEFWENDLSAREPERCIKPELLFAV